MEEFVLVVLIEMLKSGILILEDCMSLKKYSGYVNYICILKDGGMASGGTDGVINIWT